MKVTKKEREEAIEQLRKWVPKGSTVYTILRHVSKSGMQRVISVVVFLPDETHVNNGKPILIHPNYYVSKALGWPLKIKMGHDGVVVDGCGMDMGFHLVSTLSYALYGVKDGGMQLNQEWL
jgi:hypothetical protein